MSGQEARLGSTSGTLSFDREAAKRIERAYQTPDIVAQRAEVLASLALEPGESVIDVGVGPGLLALELAKAVGPAGSVVGIDASEAMVEMSRRRCAEQTWARFEIADACELPCPDGELDAAVSTQVYEYVADMGRALGELLRVLRPGGRALILDTDYDSLVLRSENPELTARILEAWDHHFVHRDLPRRLSGLLREAGFELAERRALPLLNADYHRDTFSYGLLRVMASFAVGRGAIGEEEATAWIEGFDELARRGDHFFFLSRFVFVARKPGGPPSPTEIPR